MKKDASVILRRPLDCIRTHFILIIFCANRNYGSVSNHYIAGVSNKTCSRTGCQDSNGYRNHASKYVHKNPCNNIVHMDPWLPLSLETDQGSAIRWFDYEDSIQWNNGDRVRS